MKSKSICLSAAIPAQPISPTVTASRSGDLVRWGDDNLYPARIIEAAAASPTQSAIMSALKNYVVGAGVQYGDGAPISPNPDSSWDDLFAALASDYVLFEGFALQVMRNDDGAGLTVYHQPFDQVRIGKVDEYGRNTHYLINADWRRASKRNIVEIPAYAGYDALRKGEVALVYARTLQPGELFYHRPAWTSALNYVLADAALGEYYKSLINSNFTPSAIISFPFMVDDKEKAGIHDDIVESFAGAGNAGNLLCLFGEGGSEPKVTAFKAENGDIYRDTSDKIISALAAANRVAPELCGVQRSSGFASQSELLLTQYTLLKLTKTDEYRRFIISRLDALYKAAGVELDLSCLDYDIAGELAGQTAKNDAVEAATLDDENQNINQEG